MKECHAAMESKLSAIRTGVNRRLLISLITLLLAVAPQSLLASVLNLEWDGTEWRLDNTQNFLGEALATFGVGG